MNVSDTNNSSSLLENPVGPGTLITDPNVIAAVNDKFFHSIYLASLVYTVILFALGTPGNALVIYVYLKWRRSPSRLFIITLAVYDFVNCSFTMPTEIYFLLNIIQADHPVLCKISRFTTFTMNNGSSVVLLAISIDRFMRIYKPLVPPMRTKTAEIIIIASFLIAVAVGWPALLLFGENTSKLPTKMGIIPIRTCLIDDAYKDTNWPLVFNIFLTVGTVLIDISMIIAYTYIGSQAIKAIRETRQYFPSFACSRNNSLDMSLDVSHADCMNGDHLETVRLAFKSLEKNKSPTNSVKSLERNKSPTNSVKMQHKDWRKASQTSEKKSKKQRSFSGSGDRGRRQMLKSTLMLFFVTLLFIISYIPYCVLVYRRNTTPEAYIKASVTGKAFYQLFLRSYMLSSSLNPVIYSFLSDKFRNQCKLMFHDAFSKVKLLKPR